MASGLRSKSNNDKPDNNDKLLNFIERKITECTDSLATKECISDLKNLIEDQNKHIREQKKRIDDLENKVEQLDSTVSLLQNHVNVLKWANEENEQYGRRLCLRIDGIPPEKNETSEECLLKCKKLFNEMEIDIPDNVLDRAHRIGKTKKKW